MPRFFDAHLDLAYIADAGRDMLAPDPDLAGGEDPPGAVTLPTLAPAVGACLATIFVEPGGKPAPYAYPPGDLDAARAAADRQMHIYEQWHAAGRIRLAPALAPFAAALPERDDAAPPLAALLIEGADPIRDPDDLARWAARGVVAVGLAWARASHAAAGNATPAAEDHGLTPMGRQLARAIDQLGLVHDIAHLSDRALDQLLSITDRPVIASHSNCRDLIDRGGTEVRQRHLADATIREIARRGGMIGLNLFSPFIIPGARRDRRATLDEWADHAEHAAAVAGTRAILGLGSDMDGGFSRLMLPRPIDRPADLPHLRDALAARGWSAHECDDFQSNNWARFFADAARGFTAGSSRTRPSAHPPAPAGDRAR